MSLRRGVGGGLENKDVQCFPVGGWVVGRQRETAGGCLMSPGREL